MVHLLDLDVKTKGSLPSFPTQQPGICRKKLAHEVCFIVVLVTSLTHTREARWYKCSAFQTAINDHTQPRCPFFRGKLDAIMGLGFRVELGSESACAASQATIRAA